MIESKECSACKETKPTSDFFKDNRKKSGLQSQCRKCMAKQKRERYANDEKFREKHRKYTEKNREWIRAKQRKRYLEKKKIKKFLEEAKRGIDYQKSKEMFDGL